MKHTYLKTTTSHEEENINAPLNVGFVLMKQREIVSLIQFNYIASKPSLFPLKASVRVNRPLMNDKRLCALIETP